MASFLLPASAITLLLYFLSPAPPANAATVLTLNGQPLINGENYHILPHDLKDMYPSAGLTPTPNDNNSSCPLYINQGFDFLGSPVTISSPAKIMFLTTSLPIQFSFYNVRTACNEPLRWWVAPKDSNGDSYVIVGTSGPFKPSYFFKFEEADKRKYAYYIKFCHALEFTSFGRLTVVDEECNDVGLLNNGRLGITPNSPFPVSFLGFAPRFNS